MELTDTLGVDAVIDFVNVLKPWTSLYFIRYRNFIISVEDMVGDFILGDKVN